MWRTHSSVSTCPRASASALEPAFPLRDDPEFVEWANQLKAFTSSEFSTRDATELAQDGRRTKDLQVLPVKDNASTISEHLVLLAEIDGVHVGFCVSSPGPRNSDPLFVQIVGVVPQARGRAIGLASLIAAAERDTQRDIALATRNDNDAARSLNAKFAQ